MDAVSQFEKTLRKNSKGGFARWRRIDLHNHTPVSFDYKGDKSSAIEDTAARLRETRISVVMFTDHDMLPTTEFSESVEKQSGCLVIRGVELNVFVDAWDKPANKVSKNLFFHLLIGFDPHSEQSPEYWLSDIYRNCDKQAKNSGGREIVGVSNIAKLSEILRTCGAIVIPAHMHSTPDAFKSRSIDDIYADSEFLQFARQCCTALEMRNDATASFFDGTRDETDNLHMCCLRSSDSHEAATLGSNYSWLQMEDVNFNELKSSLEMPFRFSRSEPSEPLAHIIGVNIHGNYFSDLWLAFSPHCNAFMGVKGSGKTAVLECLRFALGSEVPNVRREKVREHLEFILGPSGFVHVLVKRADGTKILIRRSLATASFEATFADNRTELFETAEALSFPSHILGWHEIEQAAEDSSIRRIYMDTIAGQSVIKNLDHDVRVLAEKVKEKHAVAFSKYSRFRELNAETVRLEERRRGLQELDDADLVGLHKEYEAALQNADILRNLPTTLENAQNQWDDNWQRLWSGLDRNPFHAQSELAAVLGPAKSIIAGLVTKTDSVSGEMLQFLLDTTGSIQTLRLELETSLNEFVGRYESKLSELTPEQRALLESHRTVADETASLPRLQQKRDQVRNELEALLDELAEFCGTIATKLDEKTSTRVSAVDSFGKDIESAGVTISVKAMVESSVLGELRSKFGAAAEIFDSVRSGDTNLRYHKRLQDRYVNLQSDLAAGDSLFFSHPDFEHYLSYFEEDDLQINFAVSETVTKPIDQLSAGQRCTAIFPLILKLHDLPLVVDQPEDNLDNRYIASHIAPTLLEDKRTRQIIFTSHNANLVVLSDAEQIVSFDGDGANGWVDIAGFLATRNSAITSEVLDVLDGGEKALEQRYMKYYGSRL